MLEFAHKNNQAPQNVTFSYGDAQMTVGDNPDWRESFDKVVSFFVLHWVPGHAKALRSMLACLKPGGEGLFIIVNSATQVIPVANQFISNHARWGKYVQVHQLQCCLP